MIGVLGGMGPLATADFFRKLIAATPARTDEEHVPVLISSDPRIPGRPSAILSGGPSPLPVLIEMRDRLIGAGAKVIAMPCNTAHHWYDELVRDCPVPFLSIVEASCAELTPLAEPGSRIGMIGTPGTLAARLFDAPLAKRHYTPLLPSADAMARTIVPAIELVKAGRVREAGEHITPAVAALFGAGASAVLLACTETPIALDAVDSPLRARCVDTTAALARACVRWWQQNGSSRA